MRAMELTAAFLLLLPVHDIAAFVARKRITVRLPQNEAAQAQVEPAAVAVGCEALGCCPGCPPASEVEWRVSVHAAAFTQATIRFRDIGQPLTALKLGGNARVDGDAIIVGPGSSSIAGLPMMASGQPPAA